jgi:hypothetical protein
MKGLIAFVSIAAVLFSLLLLSCGRDSSRLYGHWKLIPGKSASIDPWADLVLDIHADGSNVTIVKRYSAGNMHDRRVDSMTVNTEGHEVTVSIPPDRWLGEVSMGIYYGTETQRHVVARMDDPNNELHIDARETLETAQGKTDVEVKETYSLVSDGSALQLSENRSTRRSGPPLIYTFARVTR